MFYEGEGTTVDYDEAFGWFGKAAEQGHADAMFQMANMLAQGHGVPQSIYASLYWLQKSAAAGHEAAAELFPTMCSTMAAKAYSKGDPAYCRAGRRRGPIQMRDALLCHGGGRQGQVLAGKSGGPGAERGAGLSAQGALSLPHPKEKSPPGFFACRIRFSSLFHAGPPLARSQRKNRADTEKK